MLAIPNVDRIERANIFWECSKPKQLVSDRVKNRGVVPLLDHSLWRVLRAAVARSLAARYVRRQGKSRANSLTRSLHVRDVPPLREIDVKEVTDTNARVIGDSKAHEVVPRRRFLDVVKVVAVVVPDTGTDDAYDANLLRATQAR